MKRKIINSEALSRNLPPPSETFAADTMAQLRAMAAKEEAPVMKRKVLQTILIAALLLALLAATALAISTLRRSAEAEQITEARQALQDAYGLTSETIGMFSYPVVTQQDDTTTFVFRGLDGDAAKAGDYTIVLSPSGEPVVTWSHDDVDPALWQDGSPEAPVWGQPQLLWYLKDLNERNQAMGEMRWDESTPEERAAALPVLTLYDGEGDYLQYDRVAPGPEDLPPEEAIALAAQAMRDTYGIPEADIATFLSQADLGAPQDGVGPRQYQVDFYNGELPGTLIVQLDAATGKTLFTRWWTEPWDRTLPDGPLDNYEQAITEFLDEGSLALCNAAEKADIVSRIEAAGLSKLLPADTPAYAAPGPDDLSEAEAVAAGRKALLDTYTDFTPELLDAFYTAPITSLVEDTESRRWQLLYPTALTLSSEFWDTQDRLGEYQVQLNAADGTVLEVSWSLDNLRGDKTYTRETLHEAPAYGPGELALLLEIQQDLDTLITRNPTYQETWIYDFSLADVAEYHRLLREAGSPRIMDENRIPSVPGPEHLTQEEAIEIAKQALHEEMGISEEALAAAYVSVDFELVDGEAQWGFQINVFEDGIEQGCGVILDAETGEVLLTNVITGGNG